MILRKTGNLATIFKMSQKIDPREVLVHLNELGYKNINAFQLKEFIKDLRKLLKYEERKAAKENVHAKYVNPDYRTDCSESNDQDVFNALYNHSTVASKAKQVPIRDHHITVEISKPKTAPRVCHPHCMHVNKFKEDNICSCRSRECTTGPSATSTETTMKSVPPNSAATSKSSQVKFGKSKEFIKTTVLKTSKCDPVALYHQYEDIWKRISIPGVKPRADVRWAVRERMLSGPKVQIPTNTHAKRKECWR